MRLVRCEPSVRVAHNSLHATQRTQLSPAEMPALRTSVLRSWALRSSHMLVPLPRCRRRRMIAEDATLSSFCRVEQEGAGVAAERARPYDLSIVTDPEGNS